MAQMSLLDSARAELGKELGMARAERRADETWKALVFEAIRYLASTGAEFVSDDVRRLAGNPPEGTSPNAMGAIFSKAAKQGLIRMVGYGKSSRVIGHSNTVRVWRAA